MSQDFQLAWPCPHLTVEEVVPLGDDLRSLVCRQPVASLGTVRILANDEVFIPQTGLLTPAQLSTTFSGPYDLVEGEDVMEVATSFGTTTVTLGIRGKQRLTTDQVVKAIQTQGLVNSAGFAENVNGHLILSDTYRVGTDSFVRVSGSACKALGFGGAGTNTQQRGARGRKLFPGWALATRPDEITNRFPQFAEEVRSNPILKMTYTVPVQRCLRCRSTFVENDIRFASDGNAILVDNEDLLYQSAFKLLLTERSSNPFHPWYGTTIQSRIGTKALGGVAAAISEDIRRALSKLQAIQQEQAKVQRVSPEERLYSISRIQVSPHEQDPTTFLIDVTVQNASSQAIDLSIVFTAPGTVALMGSNGLFLGTETAGVTTNFLTGGS